MKPTEVIKLPSQGLIYPENNPLSKGEVEMYYMTAKHEDILANQAYINDNTVFAKLIKALIVDPSINYDEMVIGDTNALLVGARVLAYGKDYEFTYAGKSYTVDLAALDHKKVDFSEYKNKNEFEFTLPKTGVPITYKILTTKDENNINRDLEGMKKISPKASSEITTRWKYIITSIDGNREPSTIRDFVDNDFITLDSQALRDEIKRVSPDIDLTFFPDGSNNRIPINIGPNFLWVNL